MESTRGSGLEIAADGSVRGTQSFVRTLSECWSRPSLTGLEILWRWLYGAPALVLVLHVAKGILSGVPLNTEALKSMSLLDPMRFAATLAEATQALWPPVSRAAVWVAPLLLAVWVVWSSLGRTVVLRRMDSRLHARPLTVMVLQLIRVIALAGTFLLWFACVRWGAEVTVTGPLAHGGEPNLVGYFALAIVSTLGLFTLWLISSWFLSVAPLLAMLRNLGPVASLIAAMRLGPVKGKLMEVNLVLGIVKIALLVLAMVFSATPVPFESVATPEFLRQWWIFVSLLYFIASDFFHVARMLAYLKLWWAYEPSPTE